MEAFIRWQSGLSRQARNVKLGTSSTYVGNNWNVQMILPMKVECRGACLCYVSGHVCHFLGSGMNHWNGFVLFPHVIV